MDTRNALPFSDLLRSLPAGGPARELGLQRLVDAWAAAEAATALRAAADRARGQTGDVPDALLAASAVHDSISTATGANLPQPDSLEALRTAIASPAFLRHVTAWSRELRELAVTHAGTGACTIASALQLWTWTVKYFAVAPGEQTAFGELAEIFCPLLAARCRIIEIATAKQADSFSADLCHVHAAHAAATAGSICAELVFGYRRHLAWDEEGCATCYGGAELDELEGMFPGIASEARAHADVIEEDGSHAAKAGPCVRFEGVETFTRLRARLDGCLTGARLAKHRAAAALPHVISGTPALS
jgi:hypothetical protein